MRRVLDAALVLLGIAVAVPLFLPYLRPSPAAARPPSDAGAATFHAGKSPVPAPRDGCGGAGCHGAAPHLAGGGMGPFRNLHVGKVECLACHGKEGRGGWGPPRDGYSLTSTRATRGEKHAGVVRSAAGCRECHSREGEASLRAAGAGGLGASFADPMALRMMEGGARKW